MPPTRSNATSQTLPVRQMLEPLLREMRAARAPVAAEWVGPRELRAIRRHMHWTQTDMATRLNEAVGGKWRQTDISQYERGARPNPPLLRDLTTFFRTYE